MTTLIKSNSNLIQPFVVHPDLTTLPKEKILEMQQSSKILKENACAILEVTLHNLDKMQEDFVIPVGSVVDYGASKFHPWIMSFDWNDPLERHSPEATYSFDHTETTFPERTITIIIPIEPQEGSDFCFKGDEDSQDFKQAYFRDGFRKPLEINDGNVFDGTYVANFRRLNLLPFDLEIPEVPEEGAAEDKESISLQDAYAEAEDSALLAQAEANKFSEIREALHQIGLKVDKLKAFGIEVEVKIKK